ncbi:MAG: cytochrome c biogenesis protein CcdA [Spirochaetia bacterium]|nr:cytochrome c biogenesis protein CcdA [Spirochaetia bacterium]
MEETFTTNISFFGAFAAGLISFLSPCVLPLIPGYISFISGFSVQELTSGGDEKAIRSKVLINSLFFVLGFTVVFVLLGASATAVTKLMLRYLRPISIAAGIVIIIFGIHTTGLIRIPFLYQEKRFRTKDKPVTVIGSFVVGLAFAFGWTPCIGPILASILAVAAVQGTVGKGIGLLTVYSMGLGIPFMLTAWSVTLFFKAFDKIKKHMNIIEWTSGILLIIVGILMITGGLTQLAGSLSFLNKFSR